MRCVLAGVEPLPPYPRKIHLAPFLARVGSTLGMLRLRLLSLGITKILAHLLELRDAIVCGRYVDCATSLIVPVTLSPARVYPTLMLPAWPLLPHFRIRGGVCTLLPRVVDRLRLRLRFLRFSLEKASYLPVLFLLPMNIDQINEYMNGSLFPLQKATCACVVMLSRNETSGLPASLSSPTRP